MPDSEQSISFLAFGDGGYSVDYPKKKVLENPKSKEQFLRSELQEWLEDHRPEDEFDHAPIHIYQDSGIATEKSGAIPVGKAMAQWCKSNPCDFAIQLGDNIYPDGADADDGKDDQKRMNDLILSPLLPLFEQAPELVVYSALGNHDWKSSRKGVAKQIEWMNKQPNFTIGEQGYYSYTIGQAENSVEFFVLDTNMLLAGQRYYEVPLNPDGSEGELAVAIQNGTAELEDIELHEAPVSREDEKQLMWLKQGLASSTAKWKIVYGHHILWSIGGTKYAEGHVLRKLLMPTLCHYADAYIAGHEHDLELLTDDCSQVHTDNQAPLLKSNRPPLPLIISGAASKMRGKHTPFAEQQEKKYPEYELIWSKSFVWGFAHIVLHNQTNEMRVSYITTPHRPDDASEYGSVKFEQSFSFKHRSAWQ
ncbi:metallophosphoesterase [Flocculibacter collagenilyticus]|uniref:metallophosphoesterase n=1 Tax=Flocculibacter collagenilyticus TaxID=2744479 RepID=UPI001F35EA07|nr:metallophosphoesterase [Flocculibacter collagenilyticus]